MMATIRDRVERIREQHAVDGDWTSAGTWAQGGQLPSTVKLMSEFDVSESTVLIVMQLLEAEGLIDSRHGVGRFIRPLSERRGEA